MNLDLGFFSSEEHTPKTTVTFGLKDAYDADKSLKCAIRKYDSCTSGRGLGQTLPLLQLFPTFYWIDFKMDVMQHYHGKEDTVTVTITWH